MVNDTQMTIENLILVFWSTVSNFVLVNTRSPIYPWHGPFYHDCVCNGSSVL